jgi:DNA-binding transcriptional ArsR family regulator
MHDRQIIDSLAAIAHATRLRVFRLLVKAEPAGLSSGEIARRVGIPPTTMSTHLAVLARTGLITARRESRLIFYALEADAVRALFDALVSDCCDGRPELCAPLLALPKNGGATKAKASRRQNGV